MIRSTLGTLVSRSRIVGVSALGAFLIGVSAAPGATAKDMIYWANYGTQAISFTNLDGTPGFGNVNIMGATPGGPDGVTIDPTTGKIYWANDSANKIGFANLNGTGAGDLDTGSASVSAPFRDRNRLHRGQDLLGELGIQLDFLCQPERVGRRKPQHGHRNRDGADRRGGRRSRREGVLGELRWEQDLFRILRTTPAVATSTPPERL